MGGRMPESRVRIIAGQYKGRSIHFPDTPTIRPSPARLRETLFHWLNRDMLSQAVILDAFAGSGALGFEALSAGAPSVTMIDQNLKAIECIKHAANTLGLSKDRLSILRKKMPFACEHLPKEHFNMIFLDPPFTSNLYVPVLKKLIEANTLQYPLTLYTEQSQHSLEIDWAKALSSDQRIEKVKQARSGDVLGSLWLLSRMI